MANFLDSLAPGNRRIILNGVAAPTARDTLEIVCDGAELADDPSRQRTRLTIPVADDGGSGWVTFTPAFSSTGFALGNGTVAGALRQASANTMQLTATLTFGSTTSFGTGLLNLAIPDVSPDISAQIDTDFVFSGSLNDSSLLLQDASTPANNRGGMVGYADAHNLIFIPTGVAGGITSTVPWTWAVGDSLRIAVRFPAIFLGIDL